VKPCRAQWFPQAFFDLPYSSANGGSKPPPYDRNDKYPQIRRGGFHIRPFLFGLRAILESPLRAKY
jgi:hypothetical protein